MDDDDIKTEVYLQHTLSSYNLALTENLLSFDWERKTNNEQQPACWNMDNTCLLEKQGKAGVIKSCTYVIYPSADTNCYQDIPQSLWCL